METLPLAVLAVILVPILILIWRVIRLERRISSIDKHVEYDLKARLGEDAVAYAEQRGHAYGKPGQEGGRDGVKWKWTDYRDAAVDYFLTNAKQLKIETAKDDAFLHVEAALGRIRGRAGQLIRLADRATQEVQEALPMTK